MLELEQILLDDAAKVIAGQVTRAGIAGAGKLAKSIQRRFAHSADVTEISAELAEWTKSEPDWQAKLQALFDDTEPGAPATVAAPPDPYIDRDALLDQVRGRPESVHLFHGFAGSGKTAFTYQVAEMLADIFPFNRCYLDVDRYRVDGVVRFGEAMIDVLGQLGVTEIADGETQLEKQYFGVLLARRVLLIIDNVAGDVELTRLAPNWRGCLVIATTRALTADLEVKYRPAQLLGLADEDALALLADRPEAAAMIERERDTAIALLNWFGNLPLAIKEIGVLLADRAGERDPIAALLADVTATDITDLTELTALRLAATVDTLAPEAARSFPLLAALPAADFTADVAAALFGTTEVRARAIIKDFDRAALLTSLGGARYRLPHFVRDYARKRAGGAGAERIAQYYLASAIAADLRGGGRLRRIPMPDTERVWPDIRTARQWLDDNREALGALVEQFYRAGQDEQVGQLATALENLMLAKKRYDVCLTAFEFGAKAAQRLGLPRLRARMIALQGRVCTLLHLFDRAMPKLAEAAGIALAEGDGELAASTAEFTGLYHQTIGDWLTDSVARNAEYARAAACFADATGIDAPDSRAYGIHARMHANVLVMLGRAGDALTELAGLERCFEPEDERNRSRIATVRAKAYSLTDQVRARTELALARQLAEQSNSLHSYRDELDDIEAEIAYRAADYRTAHSIWGRLLQDALTARHPKSTIYQAKLNWPAYDLGDPPAGA
ncbi:MAG TPA: NB-ARC domain-containing protein [Pseudonocardiaceae bacterium]|nr:NB-ARC domain-containing protein [Pseudonocardiaceae bacterium]